MGKKALVTLASKAAKVFGIDEFSKVVREVRLNKLGQFATDPDTKQKPSFFDLPTMIADRSWCEYDSSVVQFIPYITFTRTVDDITYVFTYKRGKAGNEDRLHDLYSVGIGGHVEELPNLPDRDLKAVLIDAAKREIEEEIGSKALTPSVLQSVEQGFEKPLIYLDTRTPVESVHLGIFLTVQMDESDYKLEEGVITEAEWKPLSELASLMIRQPEAIEPWSQVVIKSLTQQDFNKQVNN